MTPLHWATEKGHAHVMEALIKHGADTTCENKVQDGDCTGSEEILNIKLCFSKLM